LSIVERNSHISSGIELSLMLNHIKEPLCFKKELLTARFISPDGKIAEKPVEIRVNPITGRKCRIAFSRIGTKEPGIQGLPPPPPDAEKRAECPFCQPRILSETPCLLPEFAPEGRLKYGESALFPNLFPYGCYSAVSLFDNRHFVEIGTASVKSYTECFLNSIQYLKKILAVNPDAHYMAITQNHLPSAGGSLVHPHLQINADRIASNNHSFLKKRAEDYFKETGRHIFSDYLYHEKKEGSRYIGKTGEWEWTSAFAPEGFFEIWGILSGVTSLFQVTDSGWESLSQGVINTQKFYRSLYRNGYNLGILFIEDRNRFLELRIIILCRSNYAQWVRNDHTGYEVMLGDMTTFTSPEETAELARPFWNICINDKQ